MLVSLVLGTLDKPIQFDSENNEGKKWMVTW